MVNPYHEQPKNAMQLRLRSPGYRAATVIHVDKEEEHKILGLHAT